ncbi:sensor histidine kinase [Pseudomarimonas salicorniae]|uniref:Histidine kinase n=1 Tax=Pseudomarimonas salicorniae TaxID=2933270 RepID=A0ABT0GHC8_9GAMM|nr:histidine kinase [Lysobacter sp. CAU 1642]MCK7593944.1 histidine kinase [Lysobacter sp. CAU 1642]
MLTHRWERWRRHWHRAWATPFEPADFCRAKILFTTLVAAELVVVVLWLAPSGLQGGGPFFAASALALWLAVLCAVLLCKMRDPLRRLPLPAGALVAWALPVLATLLACALVVELSDVLIVPGSEDGLGAELVWRSGAICAVLSAFLLRYFHVQELWLRNERAQARAAVDALQARIRPHFLFNSMNSIASLVRHDPETAERAVEDLADLFRAALGAGDGMCGLDEELALCRQYLAIEKLRLAERLEVDWRLDESLVGRVRVPKLSIQPLIENAVHHGLARLPRGGRISIGVHARGGAAEIEVLNPCPPPQDALSGGNRHALPNILQRLSYHFGDAARMTRGYHDGYYRCTVRLPLQDTANDAHPDR